MSEPQNIHATGLLLGDVGVVLRGQSGAGKSLLALELLDRWELAGETACLIADDRIDVTVARGRLLMSAPKAILGLIELRGRGIVRRPFVASTPINLVVDLVDQLDRMVEEDELVTELFGVSVSRCPVPRAGVVTPLHQLLLIREGMRDLTPVPAPARKKTT